MPLVDLGWQHRQVASEVAVSMDSVMSRGAFINGAEVARFEEEFAAFSGVAHCIGVGNGTDAIELALRASGIPAGSSVILPANTFVATAEAVVRAGCTPVLVDCDEHSLMDMSQVAERMDAETSAVLPVHLYGQMADMERLAGLAAQRGVIVLEDAAQAQGATRNGRGIGSWGRAAATSFYPGKNLGAYGDAGAVLTADGDVAHRLRLLANHGSENKYVHTEIGVNSRLDTLQAVVLRAKLSRLAGWNALRQRAAALYNEMLEPLSEAGLLKLPETAPGNTHVWHLYVIRLAHRYSVLEELTAAGIGAGIHYPLPVHLQPAFRHLGHQLGDFPCAERTASEILSLPIYPGITEEIQSRVVAALKAALSQPHRLAPSA